MDTKMTTEPLQSRASRLFGEKGKHEFARGKMRRPDGVWRYCLKCDCDIEIPVVNNPCPIPDPTVIDESDECYGRALKCFRGLMRKMSHSRLARFAIKTLQMPWEDEIRNGDTAKLRLIVLGYVAMKTAAQIWEISCEAVEQ